VVVTGSGSNRLFTVPADVNVTFRGLLLSVGSVAGTNGALDQYGGPAEGGAIFNSGNLVLDGCVISNNVSTGGVGGEISTNAIACCRDPTFPVCCEFVTGGPGRGGAIFNRGRLWLTNCFFADNRAAGGRGSTAGPQGGGGGPGFGGAVFNQG